jgi:hypothetical protein
MDVECCCLMEQHVDVVIRQVGRSRLRFADTSPTGSPPDEVWLACTLGHFPVARIVCNACL